MAHEALDTVGVNVPVTMCNGETASTAINTCNGNDCTSFLEHHGQNGRVLVDQPALWTENEGGFQTWGGAPPPGKEPYFWGRPIADQTLSVMKWFARGGSHMNYYMCVCVHPVHCHPACQSRFCYDSSVVVSAVRTIFLKYGRQAAVFANMSACMCAALF